MLFYGILLFLFGQIFSILGLGNQEIHSYPGIRENNFLELWQFSNKIEDLDKSPDKFEGPEEMPYEEFQYIGLFFGNFFAVLRMSMGDFDFGASEYLTP